VSEVYVSEGFLFSFLLGFVLHLEISDEFFWKTSLKHCFPVPPFSLSLSLYLFPALSMREQENLLRPRRSSVMGGKRNHHEYRCRERERELKGLLFV